MKWELTPCRIKFDELKKISNYDGSCSKVYYGIKFVLNNWRLIYNECYYYRCFKICELLSVF